jgi:predicted RNase H-like nuclease (RuvC/YqgF family)
MESKLSSREKYLTRLVENALGLEGYGDDNVNKQREKQGLPPAQGPKYSEGVSGDEMVNEKPLPEYKSIEELMKNIDHGTNEAACKYKMTEMKRIAQALEEKVSTLEEGEHAEHIDTKKVKQMKKDIMTLRKQADRLEKEYEKKFGEKKVKKEDK